MIMMLVNLHQFNTSTISEGINIRADASSDTIRRVPAAMDLFLPSRAKLLVLVLVLNWTYLSPALAVTVNIPLTAPSSARALSGSLVSFSLEQDRWVDWVGQGNGNSFFFNTLDNLNGLTGEPPRIRIGGNSEDRTIFDSSVQVRFVFWLGSGAIRPVLIQVKFSDSVFPVPTVNVPYPEANADVVGNNFYQLASSLPCGDCHARRY
jgi:hypothetical protein